MANTPKVYVICDANCKFEGMTKEQIYAAILQAVNEGTIGDIDSGFVQTIKTINGIGLKFFLGTQAEYEALTDEEKENLFAIITNDTTKEGIIKAITELQINLNDLNKNLNDLNENLLNGDFKVKKSENADNATYAGSAEESGYLAIEKVSKPTYNSITQSGLYCVVIKGEDENENQIYRTMMIYVKEHYQSVVKDPLSGYVLRYEYNSLYSNGKFILDNNGYDISNMIYKVYLLLRSNSVG